MTQPARHDLEHALAERLGRRHCVATGRGAAAITATLAALAPPGGRVVLPTVVCPSPASATLYAGHQPVFCDVDPRDGTVDVASLERVLDTTPGVVAVLPVHLYGHVADLDAIARIADRRGIPVVEDAAQALGATHAGRPVGSFGQASVVSFGHTKILEVGWGGAVLTDDDALARRIREIEATFPEPPADLDRRYDDWRRVYYALKPLAERDPRCDDLFLPLPGIFREMYLFRLSDERARAVLERLDDLDAAVAARRRSADRYAERLADSGLDLPVLRPGSVPWRYTVRVPTGRQRAVTDALRAAGLDASNWYPPLHRWYASGQAQDPALFPGASDLASRVLNLWVEPVVDGPYIERACDALLAILDEERPHGEPPRNP